MLRTSIWFTLFACACSSAPAPQHPVSTQHAATLPESTRHAATVLTSPPEPPREPPADHATVIGRLRPKFRDCYQAGLLLRGDQQGSVQLAMVVDPAGRPNTVKPSGGAGLDRCVVDCLVKVASNASFSPSSGGANVLVPLSFGVVR
jgi:hypothetical protein